MKKIFVKNLFMVNILIYIDKLFDIIYKNKW